MPFETLGEPARYVCDCCREAVEFVGADEYPLTRSNDSVTICEQCAQELAWEAFDARKAKP